MGFDCAKRPGEADLIIQQLKSKADKSGDDLFHLLTMEGDNWYQTNKPDKAIGPFERAVALRPEDVTAVTTWPWL